MKRRIFKTLSHLLVRPFVRIYLKKNRIYSYRGINLCIPPGVFHPGLFYSTHFLLDTVLKENLHGKHILEAGAGSGLIAFSCAKAGAIVTATDISKQVIENLHDNSRHNGIELTIIQADLFDAIPEQTYDYILINPPYYQRDPVSEADHAWYCGKENDYFRKLFGSIRNYIHSGTKVLMVLSEDCDLKGILAIARMHQFEGRIVQEKLLKFEKNYIYRFTSPA